MYLSLTHADKNQKILCNIENVNFIYTSPANQCTHLVMSGEKGVVPVKETIEEIQKALPSNFTLAFKGEE